MHYSPLDLADALIKTGELDDALDALKQHLDDTPGDDDARRLRVDVLLRVGDESGLRAALADLDVLATTTVDDHMRRSVALERLGDLAGAVRAVEAARVAAGTGDERLAERQVQLLRARGDVDAARVVVAEMPRTWRWLGWAGDLAAQGGDDQTATTHYGQALVQLDDRFDTTVHRWARAMKARLLLARANAFRRLALVEKAEADYRAAEDLVPGDPMIPFGRGLLAAQRGDLETATSLCGEALATVSGPLRAEMTRTLREVPTYAALAQALEIL